MSTCRVGRYWSAIGRVSRTRPPPDRAKKAAVLSLRLLTETEKVRRPALSHSENECASPRTASDRHRSEANDQVHCRHELGELGALLEGRVVEGVLIDELWPDEDVLLEEMRPAHAMADVARGNAGTLAVDVIEILVAK